MTGNEWLMILGMTGVTFGIRYFLFGLADRIRMPSVIEDSLQYIPPAVLIAITMPAIFLPKGVWDISFSNAYLAAAVITAAAGVITRNLLATIAIGLISFFVYQGMF
jgi:branched-subunit amino acid transport protein